MNIEIKKVLQAIEVDPEWHEKVENNEKRVTIREGARDYVNGKVILYWTPISWCLTKEIISVEHIILKDISNETAQEDGFTNQTDLKEKLTKYYPKISNDSIVSVIRWK
jgi:hypothetical protein